MEGTTHEHLLETARVSLPSRVGTTYKQAVCACLDWEDDENGVEAGLEAEELRTQRQRQIEKFANKVAAVLRDCHCML